MAPPLPRPRIPFLQPFSRLHRPGWLTALPGGLRLWITLLSLGFVLAALWGHGLELLRLPLDPQGWFWLAEGVGFSLLSLVVNALAWQVLLRWSGHRLPTAGVLELFLLTNLRKYLPGGIWHLAARLQALRRGELAPAPPLGTAAALLAVLLEPLLMAMAALLLVLAGGWQGGLALLALTPLPLLLPRWLAPLLQRLEQRRGRELGLDEELEPDSPRLAGVPWVPFLAELVFVLARFAGFACCVRAFDLVFPLGWPLWLAAFALAWTAGLVVPGAPSGLGVFEAVLLLRLAAEAPQAPLLAVALSYRLVTTLADLLAAGLVLLERRWPAAARP